MNLIFCIFFSLLSLIIIFYTIYIIYLQLLPGAFYYPTTDKTVETIFRNIKLKSNDVFIDLGSGDGRIIIAAAQKNIKSIGYELDPILVKKSRQKINQLKLSQFTEIKFKNFWQADFDQATIISIYQFPKYMTKLEKIFQSLNHPLTVITNTYPFPNQKPYLIKNKLYFYKFP